MLTASTTMSGSRQQYQLAASELPHTPNAPRSCPRCPGIRRTQAGWAVSTFQPRIAGAFYVRRGVSYEVARLVTLAPPGLSLDTYARAVLVLRP